MLKNMQEVLEYGFKVLNEVYFENMLPPVVITIMSSPKTYGHFTTGKVWKAEEEHYNEINISAEHLDRNIENTMATLMHEMVHFYCQLNGIADTSQDGRYHNKFFKREAEARGLIISYAKYIGYSVCRVLAAMGYAVYDCDSRAKALMDVSERIKSLLAERISPAVITAEGEIDRRVLASIVFSDSDRLGVLNEIVHAEVRADLAEWAAGRPLAFVETAILYESGLDAMVDEVWMVDAPKEMRVERVMKRSSMSAAEVEARIESQLAFTPSKLHPKTHLIVNDNFRAVLPQVEQLLSPYDKPLRV